MNRKAFLILALVLGLGAWLYRVETRRSRVPSAGAASAVASLPASKNPVSAPRATNAASAVQFASFRKRPLPVARESDACQWTTEDGKDTNVIRRLAHNELEYDRMVDENARIIRRQLVYHKETADVLVQRARLSGEPIRQLTLPGLDGQEIQVELTKTELNPSGQQGAFAGRVVGRLDSMVTFAFKGGREAFTVISPSDYLFLQADPREPGELIVKSIDPETYVVGVCGNP